MRFGIDKMLLKCSNLLNFPKKETKHCFYLCTTKFHKEMYIYRNEKILVSMLAMSGLI